MATPRKPRRQPAPTAPTPAPEPASESPADESVLRALALDDPLLLEARRRQQKGEAPPVTYHAAWDAWDAEHPGRPFEPQAGVEEYLRQRWPLLLLEGEDERAKVGRPSLLTPALLAEIERLAVTGLKDPLIYRKLGIRHQLWSDWTKDPDGDLARALARARATLAENLLRDLALMPKGWQAGVWLLTQHFPDEYTRPNADTSIHVNASASASISVEVTPETLAKIQARRQQLLADHGRN